MANISPYIRIIRPINLLFSALTVMIAAFLLDQMQQSGIIFVAMAVVVTFAAASNILNDIFDINIDSVNQPMRPLPSGEISLYLVSVYMIILYVTGIYFTFSLPKTAIQIAFGLVLPILILYTPILKRIPLLGNIAIGVVLGCVFLFAEAALTGKVSDMWTPAWLTFGLTFIRELVKDIEDMEGDRKDAACTFPAVFGIKRSLQLTYLLIIIFCLIWWLPYIRGSYGIMYAFLLFLLVEIPLIFSIFFLWRNPTSSGCAMISRATKWITLGGMITILCSKF